MHLIAFATSYKYFNTCRTTVCLLTPDREKTKQNKEHRSVQTNIKLWFSVQMHKPVRIHHKLLWHLLFWRTSACQTLTWLPSIFFLQPFQQPKKITGFSLQVMENNRNSNAQQPHRVFFTPQRPPSWFTSIILRASAPGRLTPRLTLIYSIWNKSLKNTYQTIYLYIYIYITY